MDEAILVELFSRHGWNCDIKMGIVHLVEKFGKRISIKEEIPKQLLGSLLHRAILLCDIT